MRWGRHEVNAGFAFAMRSNEDRLSDIRVSRIGLSSSVSVIPADEKIQHTQV